MRTANNAFLTALSANGRKISAKLKYNSNAIIGDILTANLEYGCNSDSNALTIGSTYASKLEMTINTTETLESKELAYLIGLDVSGNVTDVQMGIFKVDSHKKSGNTIELTAYDRMYYLANKLYSSSYSTTCTIAQAFTELCTSMDVTVSYKGISSTELAQTINMKTGYTRREMIGYLATCLCAFAYFDSTGNLVVSKFGSGSTVNINSDKYFELSTAESNTDIAKVIVHADSETEYSYGSTGTYVEVDCPVITESVFNTMKTVAVAISNYRAGSIDMIGNMLIEPCDSINITDVNSNTYLMYPMMVRQTFDGGLSTSIECYAKSETESDTEYKSPQIQRMDRIYAELMTVRQLITDSITTDYLEANYAQINLANIEEACIKTAMIEDAAIGTAKIALGAITNALIAESAVGTAQIADASITDAKILELTANKVTSGTLSTERLVITGSTGSIVYALNNAGELVSQSVDTVDGDVITDRTVTADKIVVESITSNELASNSVTANKILSNSVTTDKLAALAVTASKIDVTDLFAQDIIFTGSITGGTSTSGGIIKSNGATYTKNTVNRSTSNGTNYTATQYDVTNGTVIDLINGCIATKGFNVASDGSATFDGSIIYPYYSNNQNATMHRKNADSYLQWYDSANDHIGAEFLVSHNLFNMRPSEYGWANDGTCVELEIGAGAIQLVAGKNKYETGSGNDPVGLGIVHIAPTYVSITRINAEVPASNNTFNTEDIDFSVDGDILAKCINIGKENILGASYSSAIGAGLTTSRGYQLVCGTYNHNYNNNMFEVGIGSSDSSRKNAFEVSQDGTSYFMYQGNWVDPYPGGSAAVKVSGDLVSDRIYAGTTQITSDERLKKNISEVKINDAVGKINQLSFKKFDWKSNNKHVNLGLIAQEVEKIIPEAVTRAESDMDDPMRSIDYNALILYLCKAIQELSSEIKQA